MSETTRTDMAGKASGVPEADAQVVQENKKSGHVNNLDTEQETALKQIWKRLLDTVKSDGGLGLVAAKDAKSGAADEAANAHNGAPSANVDATDSTSDPQAAAKGKGKNGRPGAMKRQPTNNDNENAEATHAEEEAMLDDLLKDHGAAQLHKAFWQFCMGEDPDALLLRFLRARKWDVDKAWKMLASTLKWRIETNIDPIIAAGEEGLCKDEGVKKNFELGKCYYHGTDKEGRPLIFARVKQHKASDQTQEEMLKFIVYNMEVSRTLFPLGSGIETASVVFDMTGFGLSNMDWDTATMVINIFQSYYPETLGHAIVWNAPTVFSAVWKIVKPMLDPVVREKVAFCNNAKEIEKFIDRKHLEKDFGGSSTWSYTFHTPEADENKEMENTEVRNERLTAFVQVAEKLEDLTNKWIEGDEEAGKKRRDKVMKELNVRRLDLDPYVRGKSSFARDGTVVGDGQVIWTYDHGRKEHFGISANDWAEEFNIEEPEKRPHNKSAFSDDIELNSDEDTVSSTDPSEDDPLDDPHHHHHSAVTVGFAKFGDTLANGVSKITPGPSLHKKKEKERAKRHADHEKRRQEKIARKRAQLEAERARKEEEASHAQEDEDAINSSYQTWLGSFSKLTLSAGNKAADYVPAVVGGNYLKQFTTTEAA